MSYAISQPVPMMAGTASQELRRIEEVLEQAASCDAHPSRVVVVMPAYNAEKTIHRTVADLPLDAIDEIIVVDDCSQDGTVRLARDLGLTVIERRRNGGYGANQKTCYEHALERGADYVAMVHPDYQYDSRVVSAAVEFLRLGICDVVLGSRIRSRKEALQHGMPAYKYWANRFLTTLENYALGQNNGDLHSGFRAYSRTVLETIPFQYNSDDFVFDSQFLAQAAYFGFRIGDIPMPVRYFPEASSINFRRSVKYGLSTLGVMAEYWGNKLKIRKTARFASAKP